jgi:acetate kinase
MTDAILVLNAGSSSIKFSLFACPQSAQPLTLIYKGAMTGIGTDAKFKATDAQSNVLSEQNLGSAHHDETLSVLLDWVESHGDGMNIVAAGHRVVHGGGVYSVPVQVSPEVFKRLEEFIPLAPLHQPHNLAPIQVLNTLKPGILQVACFDTAFHTTQPPVAQAFALPRAISAQGIKRYGFHGLSYEYIAQSMPEYIGNVPEKVVVAHLGNGVSMAALQNGKSIATTLGFTALDGLPMGTRSGSVDPGVLLHLLNTGMDVKQLGAMLYNQSGLLGVSGISNDMQVLLDSEHPHAKEAIDLFVYRINRELASLAATMGGLDALIFTAGIGQHAAPVRAQVCELASWLGIELDDAANKKHAARISTSDSKVSVWVIPTDEEKMIAQHTLKLLQP